MIVPAEAAGMPHPLAGSTPSVSEPDRGSWSTPENREVVGSAFYSTRSASDQIEHTHWTILIRVLGLQQSEGAIDSQQGPA